VGSIETIDRQHVGIGYDAQLRRMSGFADLHRPSKRGSGASVDVVVSDLPVSRQSSSSAKPDQLLPLVVAELSRVV
jgi:hypothetical protein